MLYGTIAKMKILPGKEADMMKLTSGERPKGLVFQHVYKLDSGNDEYMLAVGFESKDAYKKNAESPEMNEMYTEYRKLLAADPEWHDGDIVQSLP